MGNKNSTPLQSCLDRVCRDYDVDCVAYPGGLYNATWARNYNLEDPVEPIAVIRPRTTIMVVNAVDCAFQHGSFVQARSGGHSYGNFGLGGTDGAVVIDLVHLDDFSIDGNWVASVGAGLRLGDLDKKLEENGKRAIPHGTSPDVGVGGQAVVGGIGPSSRVWGNMADHIVQMEVVTGNGNVVRASEVENPDLYWALRGAGPSFGIVTRFWIQTHPQPSSVIEYTYDVSYGGEGATRQIFEQWQALAGDASLDRRFSSLLIIHPLGVVVSGTFYGTQQEFEETGIPDRLPSSGSYKSTDWISSVAQRFESTILHLSDTPVHFASKSLALRQQDLLKKNESDALFDHLYGDEAPLVMTFNTVGGAVADLPLNHTSYPHRDKVVMCEAYVIGKHEIAHHHRRFLDALYNLVKRDMRLGASAYAGYVDRSMNHANATLAYWGDMLPRLRLIKQKWDPYNQLRNPQSIWPIDVKIPSYVRPWEKGGGGLKGLGLFGLTKKGKFKLGFP